MHNYEVCKSNFLHEFDSTRHGRDNKYINFENICVGKQFRNICVGIILQMLTRDTLWAYLYAQGIPYTTNSWLFAFVEY